jgi:hypothetical protein
VRLVVRFFSSAWILAAFGAGLVSAQSAIDFNLLVTENGQSSNVLNGQTIPVTTQVGTKAQVTVVATYLGSTQATISAPPLVEGSTEYTATITGPTTAPPSTATPIVLGPGQNLTFVVTYAPTSATQANATVEIVYTEPGSTSPTVSNAIFLAFEGFSPNFSLFYILQSNGDSVPISSGQAIPFGPTLLNTSANANLDIYNTGSGPGSITAITPPPAGSPFKVEGIPPLPAGGYSVAAGTFLPLVVQYTPTAVENDNAQITISFQNGATDTVLLTGNGIASTFSYTYLTGAGTTATPVLPGGTITFPPVNVATAGTTPTSSPVIVQVKNTGTISSTISSLSVLGQGFSLVTPLVAVVTLAPGGTYNFSINFTPTQPGTQTGQLAVGSDVFVLSGIGQGPSLTFSYTSSAGTIAVGAGGAVDFTPIAVTKSESVTFTVTNSGTSTATISNISTTSSSTPNPFSVSSPPLSLMAGQMAQFTITFSPSIVETVTGTLILDNTQVGLLGTGLAPPALPSYTITGPSGNVSPASQENVSLTLASPYPVDVDGVLTLTTSGNYGSDPAVQFSTGSSAGNRTVDFTIAANSTSADFVGQGSQILLQTGTVAETVTLAPTFETTDGVPLTPASATLQFTIPSLAPAIETVQVTNESATSFTLLVNGYTTLRSLGTLTVTLNAASGYSLASTQFPLDVSHAGALWFQSASSQSYGGLFQISIPFNLTGPVTATTSPIQAIASVAVTLSNSIGTSGSQQAPVQ